MGQIKSLAYPDDNITMWMDDDTANKKKNKKPGKERNFWEEEDYDESWDHIYDDNEYENKERRLNRSEKYKNNKQDW
jgi:hypothetical protein